MGGIGALRLAAKPAARSGDRSFRKYFSRAAASCYFCFGLQPLRTMPKPTQGLKPDLNFALFGTTEVMP
jgi:hypothetical protein